MAQTAGISGPINAWLAAARFSRFAMKKGAARRLLAMASG
jgi:hypothetical protein